VAMWSQQLSPGEQQRISFVRVLLHKPSWVFLDESTSSLDLENEKRMYALLKKDLPDCSIISVGHRPSLDAYHDEVLDFEKYSVARELA
jgi:putative ATP-binding cassette transporter